MKRQAYKMMGALIVLSMVAISSARAQSVNKPLIATIPFEFSAGNRTMPAGKYAVTVINPSSDQRVMKLQSLDNAESTMVRMHSVIGVARDEGRLVFHRYGERYFLAQAWTTGDATGMEAAKSKIERAADKEMADTKRGTETIALNRR